MNIGVIGLGKMGLNLALNMQEKGFNVVGWDTGTDSLNQAAALGLKTVGSIDDMIDTLASKRIIWLMVPAGEAVDKTLEQLRFKLSVGDIVIDGGNSFYKDSIRRATYMNELQIDYLDCGTSGGINGARNGVCAMVGGNRFAFNYCEPLLKAISVSDGYLYCGASGSGHYVKMIHNGIEYGMMQSIAEGFDLLEKSPMNLPLESIAKVWNHGSVIRSWLMELTESALRKDPDLSSIKGIMHSSGEGKWTLETALELQTATPVIALALMMRYRSLEADTFSGKIVAALRNEFGGHAVEKS